MKIFIILILLAFGNLYYSQSFTIIELQNLVQKNSDDFDTFVSQKGYLFNTSEKDNLYEKKSYTFGRNPNSKNLSLFFITKFEYSDGSKIVSWQTIKQSDYLKIKMELKKLGYKYLSSEITTSGANANYYKLKNKLLSLFSGTAKDAYGNDGNYFEISITVN